MKIKQTDIEINNENPFENCKLEREKYAKVLTTIVGRYSDGFVMSINNEWGTGKTTFVKMWQKFLDKNGFVTLYFNAWENDFDNNPLVALMAELKTLDKSSSKVFKSLLEKGAVLAKNIIPDLIKALAAKHLDQEVLKDLVNNVSKAGVDILSDEIKTYTSKKKGLLEFKKELEVFVKEESKEKPIIFIIDELDRCRPDYAVSILEQIKHFFSVKGIVFVLSIDKVQLGNAVRGVYGSDNINADEYLRRFIDIEYSIEPPITSLFCEYLFNHFELNKVFYNEHRKSLDYFGNEKKLFLKTAVMIFNHSNLTLRQQEKIFAHTRIVLTFFTFQDKIFPDLLICLIYIKNFKKDLYDDIKNKRLSLESLLAGFARIFPENIDGNEISTYTEIEASLVSMYNNYLKPNDFKLITNTSLRNVNVDSKINKSNQNDFHRQVLEFEHYNGFAKIDYLLSKIDLTNFINK